MNAVNIHQAKSRLSRLIAAVESGEENEVVIARNGKPVVKLVLLDPPKQRLRFGLAKGKYVIPDNIDRDEEEIIREFEGENE